MANSTQQARNVDGSLRIDGDEGRFRGRAGQYWERGRGWLPWRYCTICGAKTRQDQLQHCGGGARNPRPERAEGSEQAIDAD